MADREQDKKQVIVHIGPHKTGSTAVQQCLTANRGVLAQAGILFLHDSATHDAAMLFAREDFETAEERLQALATQAQILVVTHSPQVAALGRHHWRVEKRVTGGQTLSTVTALSADQRIEEIARMVAGDRVTEAARDAARALLGAQTV